MRFFGFGETLDLAALYLRLAREGHEVQVFSTEPGARGTLEGLLPRAPGFWAGLEWVGREGVVIFESVSAGFGARQDALRAEGFRVVGGGAFGDRLETDRAFGLSVLSVAGLRPPPAHPFETPAEALAFVTATPGRYVVKASGADHGARDTYVGGLADGRDVAALLRSRCRRAPATPLVLSKVVEGVEVGVGAYFDGSRFLQPACLDFEHKRFFPGDLGELTGEMGTVATFMGSEPLFQQTLQRIAPALAGRGHVGWVNLNTLVNEDGIWPLEFTCRFGYPGFAVLGPLQETPWGELLDGLCTARLKTLAVRTGWSVGLVLTTPPFPYSRHELPDEEVGRPVVVGPDVDPQALHLCEVGLSAEGDLVTSGLYGWTAVVTGCAPSLGEAQAQALAAARGVFTPDLRYRQDIGARLQAGELKRLERLGLFSP